MCTGTERSRVYMDSSLKVAKLIEKVFFSLTAREFLGTIREAKSPRTRKSDEVMKH